MITARRSLADSFWIPIDSPWLQEPEWVVSSNITEIKTWIDWIFYTLEECMKQSPSTWIKPGKKWTQYKSWLMS